MCPVVPNPNGDFEVVTPEPENIQRGFSLWRDAMRWQRMADSTLKPFELTHTQYLVLASTLSLTEAKEDAVQQRAVAEHAGLDQATTSRIATALSLRGLLDRGPTLGDARAWRIIVTARGQALVKRVAPEFEKVAFEFFSKLPNG